MDDSPEDLLRCVRKLQRAGLMTSGMDKIDSTRAEVLRLAGQLIVARASRSDVSNVDYEANACARAAWEVVTTIDSIIAAERVRHG